MKKTLLYALISLPSFLGALIAALLWPIMGGSWTVDRGALWLTFTRGARFWRYSTTLGVTVLSHPEHGDHVKAHELVHVRQFQGDSLSGLAIALIAYLGGCHWLACVAIYSANHWLTYLGHGCAAYLSGLAFYKGNAYERHARGDGFIA